MPDANLYRGGAHLEILSRIECVSNVTVVVPLPVSQEWSNSSNASNATENSTESNESNDTSEAEGNDSNGSDSDEAFNVSLNLSELFEEAPKVYFVVERIASGPVWGAERPFRVSDLRWEVHGSKTWDQERQAGEGAQDISLIIY